MKKNHPYLVLPMAMLAVCEHVQAKEKVNEEHIVTHGYNTILKEKPPIGGNLQLSVQHNPATINIITKTIMNQRGYMHAEDAADSAPGVTSGGSPGNPAQFMMRGFSGNQILILRDGFYYGPTTMINRPLNTFNLQSIQILKGPSSVLYGQGSVGGTVDMRTKDPQFDRVHLNTLVSYGSFNTWNGGVGGSVPINRQLAIRADFSRSSSDGYVKGSDPHSNDLTVTALWKPDAHFSNRFSVDYLKDRLSTYYGTPLVSLIGSIDKAGGLLSSSEGVGIRRASLWNYYNVQNARANSVNIAPTLQSSWKINKRVEFHNKAYFLYAKRLWDNAESYNYIASADQVNAQGQNIKQGDIGRDRFYVYQNQHQVGDTMDGRFDFHVANMKNRLVLGGDAYYIRLIRSRGFPNADYADSVSLEAPQETSLGRFAGEYPAMKSPTTLLNAGLFLEDVLNIQKNLRLIGGFRYNWLSLNRQNYRQNGSFNTITSFKGYYNPVNFRVGTVYDLTKEMSLYGVYTTAEDPPGANIFLANKGQFTRLSHSNQEEIGLKGLFFHQKLLSTLSLYNIRRSQILEATGVDAVSTAGRQKSRGVEWDSQITFTKHLSVSGNLAYTWSRYENFHPSVDVDASGNEVPNVPKLTANMWGTWYHVADLPFDLGTGVRYVSARKGNFSNTLSLKDYALVNVFATWHFVHHITLSGRIDNLANKHFIQWADTSYSSQVLLGSPRVFSLSARADF
ncbi:TonB-dependent receptor [Swingsia samuiensis]|uniref:TonB-dependent receptor n=1 Tax=Swingsia samuiensis TaxID=1293412 RepID=A0A4Y6UL13_9PROT|nr:TonB-dependent receptor [Swingsia samuiensis]QDH17764.1 TonB-dependent receptor [Swingsia samuiensis]